MADKKVVFVAFAIEDERQRDFLKGQSLSPRAPYEFIDMSVKEAYETDWQEKVRTRIKRSHGIIVLVSENSLTSTGQKWEITCAKEVGKPVRGIWAYSDDRTTIDGVSTLAWSDKNISDFIDSLWMGMRKALIVGVDYYEHIGSLHGGVNDAYAVNSVLERHSDGTLNFSNPKLLTSTGPNSTVDRKRAEGCSAGAVP